MTDPPALVCRLGYADLVDLILGATERVVYAAPGVHPELAHALVEARSRDEFAVRVLLDPSEWSFRNGFGETSAVDTLLAGRVDVRQVPGLQVGFLVADTQAFFLFPQSRAHVVEGTGDNAVAMDRLTSERLVLHYFPPGTVEEWAEASFNLKAAADERAHHAGAEAHAAAAYPSEQPGAALIDTDAWEQTRERLSANAPVQPDLRRKIDVYIHKLQFAELKIEGSGFHNARIELPSGALPVSNPELRKALEARMKVFPDRDELGKSDEFKPYFALKDDARRIRDTYFVHAPSRKKNVFLVEHKPKMLQEIDALREQTAAAADALTGHLRAHIIRRRKLLREQIETILHENPPDDLVALHPDLFDDEATTRAHRIVDKARFPDPDKLVGALSVTLRTFDPTWEDFSDADFISELHERGLIAGPDADHLRSLRKAYETQRSDSNPSVSTNA